MALADASSVYSQPDEADANTPCLVVSTCDTGDKTHRAFRGIGEALRHVEEIHNAGEVTDAKVYFMREIDLR